ncbi:hypothetical protein BWR19_17310 [Halomonas sp. 1513]|nr:pilus assembly PilX N-terminal domain-containing protein [Halomonas sp. 1513]APX94543.1 hypothetical protein BWR19_17310 [Halomonas sp. 1513]
MKKQKGAALIVVLSLLVVSLMLGLSSMQSSQIDERLAGNYRVQTEAQMNAEAGASRGLKDIEPGAGWSASFESLADFLEDNESVFPLDVFSGWEGFELLGNLRKTPPESEGGWAYSLLNLPDDEEIPVPAGNYVVSVGVVRESGDDEGFISQSELVFARIVPAFVGFDSALTVLGGIVDSDRAAVWQPTSSQAEVTIVQDGEEVITLSSLAYEHPEEILDIDENVFDSGILYYGEPSTRTSQTVKSIYDSVVGSSMPNSAIIDGNVDTNGNGVKYNGETIGECYEEGNGNRGDVSADPAILVVTGDLRLRGGAQFCGVLVSLGGNVTMGGNVVVNGMLLAANYPKVDGEVDFSVPSDPVDIVFSGGGNAGSVKFDEQIVRDAINGVIDWSSFIGTGAGVPRLASWN